MHTCQKCGNCFTRKNNLSRHEKEVCKGVRQSTSSGSLKRQKTVPELLDWEIKDDDSNLGDQVTSDEENSEVNMDDIKKDFGLWLKKLERLIDNPNRWKGSGIGPKYRGGTIPEKIGAIPVRPPEVEEDSGEAEEKAALENLIAYDKKKLLNLLKEFAAVIDEEDASKLVELGSLLDDFFVSESKPIGWGKSEKYKPKVYTQLDQLINSKIPRTKLEEAKIYVNDLDKKRHILQEMFRGIENGRVGEIGKRLCQEGMISLEMYDKLRKLENPNFENIAEIVKSDLHVQSI